MTLKDLRYMEWLRRYINKKERSVHFGNEDIILDKNVRINNIDIIPETFNSGDEISFWMDTGYDVYLLMLRDADGHSVEICPSSDNYPVVCVVIKILLAGRKFDDEVKREMYALLLEAGSPRIQNEKFHTEKSTC